MRSVEMPVSIITGTADLQIPVSMGERLYQAAPESKQLIVIQGGGHDNHLSKKYRQRIQQFIKRVMRKSD